VSNKPTIDVDLNEATLLNAMIAIRTNFKDQAGLKVFARGRKLIVPPDLEPVAIRLTKTELRPARPTTMSNAILDDRWRSAGRLHGERLLAPLQYAWFLLTNIDGLSTWSA
jgi:hypothetical protein